MLRYLNYVTGLVRAVSVPVGYGLKFCFAQLRFFFIASLKIVSSSQCLHQTEALVASSFWLHDDTSGSIADPGLASLSNYHQKLNINGDPCWNKILFFFSIKTWSQRCTLTNMTNLKSLFRWLKKYKRNFNSYERMKSMRVSSEELYPAWSDCQGLEA